MRKYEIATFSDADRESYRRLSSSLENELILHSGHVEQHLGLTTDLPGLLLDCQQQGWVC